MSGYARGEGFGCSEELFGQLTAWAGGPEAGVPGLAGLEAELGARILELGGRVMQDLLDVRAAREEAALAQARRDGPVAVTGPDGVSRTRAGTGHSRPLSTVFGPRRVTRVAYRAPGAGNWHPGDEELGLAPGPYSPGLEKMAVLAEARGPLGQACAQVRERTGCALGTRQCQEMAVRAMTDFGDFCASRRPPAPGPGQVLVISCDGKGVRMRPGQQRPRSQRKSEPKQEGRLSRGEVRTRKRMAEVGAVYAVTPVPRTPEDIMGPGPEPGAPEPGAPEPGAPEPGAPEPGAPEDITGPGPDARGPKAESKWLTVSIDRPAAAVVTGLFAEADRRDPRREATWIGLADGSKDQIRWMQAEAARRRVTLKIIIDFIHVLEYLWKAAWAFFPEASPEAGPWVRDCAAAILAGHATGTAAAIRARAAATPGLSKAKRAAAAETARYLEVKAPYLDYPAALANGWPIATGVIEGACRHLIKDRMDITGARWTTKTAEAILQTRALLANDDFDEYWAYHLNREHHRNHPRPQNTYDLAV